MAANRLLFCMAKSCVSRGITGVKCGFWWFSGIVVEGPGRDQGEGGTPLLGRHMGGGVIPS